MYNNAVHVSSKWIIVKKLTAKVVKKNSLKSSIGQIISLGTVHGIVLPVMRS